MGQAQRWMAGESAGMRAQHINNKNSVRENKIKETHGRIGGGGSRGSGPSFLVHDVGLLTLGPKLDPLSLMDLPPLF